MTATERLRELLTERGVRHEDEFLKSNIPFYDGLEMTEWNGGLFIYVEMINHPPDTPPDAPDLTIHNCTPQQAIAATLGDDDVYTREDCESAFVRGYSLGSLPVGSDPQWDENEQTVDEHMAELGWVRAATLGFPKAKAHPYGYEPDTGAFDATRCECGCVNDISATYCNDCGGEIEIDMNAEKEIYHCPRHPVFVEKHDDGSLEFCGERYITATFGHSLNNQSMSETLSERGTCRWEYPQGVNGWVGYIVCSNCQHQFNGVDEREWTCCPACGAKVVD